MIFDIIFTFDTNASQPVISVGATVKSGTVYPANLNFKITSPIDVVLKDYSEYPDLNFNSPVEGDEQTLVLAEIPLAVGGDFLTGTYVFEITEKNVDSGEETVQEVDYYYCPPTQCSDGVTGNLEFTVSCSSLLIELKDSTDYKTTEIVSRALKMSVPAYPGRAQATIESTADTITDELEYENVTYGGTLLSVISKSTVVDEITFTVVDKVEDLIEEKVTCGAKGCELITCANQILAAQFTEACKVQGINNLKISDQNLITSISSWLASYNASVQCGDSDGIDMALVWLGKITSGRCTCNTTSSEPRPISTSIGLGITNQTAWSLVPESALSNAEYIKIGPNVVDQIRYRKTATKHLEIQGGFKFKPDGESPLTNTPILRNYFIGEMLSDEYDTFRSYDGDWKEQGFMKYKKNGDESNFSLYFVGLNTFENDTIKFHLMIPIV